MAIYDINGNAISGTTELEEYKRRLGLHLTPNSMGELNMVKRARQFTDIKWTPCVERYRGGTVEDDVDVSLSQQIDDRFLADTEYVGIPYSRGDVRSSGMPAYGKEHGYVGFDVPLSAFVSSVTNPYSYFCTSTYHSGGNNVAYTPYGVTCDTLVCYAMGLAEWYGSDAGFQRLLNNGVISQVCSGDAIQANIANIHLGDILWKKAVHVAIITDVMIDDGDIYIEVSEATTRGNTDTITIGGKKGGLSRRELWGMDKFFTRFYGYTVYRYNSVESVEYEQSPFVTLQDESPLHNLIDRLPLIPYMGYGFEYKVGYIPNSTVVIKDTSYDSLAVYKDGELFNTFEVTGNTVDVGFSAVGSYEAFLFNGTIGSMTARTASCKWSVIS